MCLLFENTHLLEKINEFRRPVQYPKIEDKFILDVQIYINL